MRKLSPEAFKPKKRGDSADAENKNTENRKIAMRRSPKKERKRSLGFDADDEEEPVEPFERFDKQGKVPMWFPNKFGGLGYVVCKYWHALADDNDFVNEDSVEDSKKRKKARKKTEVPHWKY